MRKVWPDCGKAAFEIGPFTLQNCLDSHTKKQQLSVVGSGSLVTANTLWKTECSTFLLREFKLNKTRTLTTKQKSNQYAYIRTVESNFSQYKKNKNKSEAHC